jgi:predicted transcriptional regulator
MKVLLSIKPEFALRIFDESKKYEYRRIIFKRREVETVVVYASDPIKLVIGEFDIGEILHKKPEQLWAQTYNHAGITKTRFLEYFGDQPKGYAIEIKKTRKYQTPLSLNELMLSLPPQSFMYLYTDPMDCSYDNAKNSLDSLSGNIPLSALA